MFVYITLINIIDNRLLKTEFLSNYCSSHLC